MAARGGRAALLGLAWVASALFAGWLLAPWFAGGPPLPSVPSPAGGVDAPAPSVSGPAGARGAAAPPSTLTDHTDAVRLADIARGEPREVAPARAGESLPAEALATATLHVSVRRVTAESPGDGFAYILPAGAPGTDEDEAVLHAELADGCATLTVPAGHRLDVGVIGEFGAALTHDVELTAGEVRELELSPPRGARITVECESPVEILGQTCEGARIELRPVARGLEFPGRGQTGECGWLKAPLDADGRGETGPVPIDLAYTVYPMLLFGGDGDPTPWPHYLIAELSEVRAGGRVRVRAERHGLLRLRVELDDSTHYGNVLIWAVGPGGPHWAWKGSGVPPKDLREMVLPVQAGTYTVRWFATTVEPGEAAAVELRPGGAAEVSIVLRPSAQPRAPAFEVPEFRADVVADGAEPGRSAHRSHWWLLSIPGVPESTGGEQIECLCVVDQARGRLVERKSVDRETPRLELDAPAEARFGPAVASLGSWWATRPFELREGASPHVQFEAAGLLCVVPGSLRAWGDPPVTIERTDGAPLAVAASEFAPFTGNGERGMSLSSAAESLDTKLWAGQVLGPFPAGVMRFRVKRGGFVLGEVSAEVVAGQIRPLLLAR